MNTYYILHYSQIYLHKVFPKTEILLGCIYEEAELRKAVAQFNSTHSDYYITIENYLSEDRETTINTMYNAILASKGPDIIAIEPNYADYYMLGTKGILEDLTPYIRDSKVVNEETFIQSVYQALKTNDELFILPTNFVIDTMITKKKWSGNQSPWTAKQLLDLLENNPDFAEVSTSKYNMIRYCITYNVLANMDPNFELDQDVFMDYLELANYMPDIAWVNTSYSLGREGYLPFESYMIYDVKNYMFHKSVWGEDSTYIGYPDVAGNGMIISPKNSFGISSRSQYKEIAWEFIECFFTEYWQENITPNWAFSTLESTFNRQLELSKQIHTYEDVDGATKEIPFFSYYYDEENRYEDIFAPKEEDIQSLKEMIQGAEVIHRDFTPIFNSVYEELLPYFAGDKTADEVLKIVKSILTLYANE